jgi:hypothetical protein
VVIAAVTGYLLFTSNSSSPLIGKPVSASDMLSLEAIAHNNTLANQVGYGVATPGSGSNWPAKVTGSPYIFNGKPEVLYVGGEFCPYCAVTRWGLILALMRFGNFTGLEYMQSSPTDYAADTATFSFVNSSYTSSLIHFDGLELTNRSEGNITTANFTGREQLAYGKYGSGGIPFIDFGNTSVQNGAMVSPIYVHGYTWDQIISNLSTQSSLESQAVLGEADVFTAYICRSNSTLNMTAEACQQPYVKKILQAT